MPFCGVEYATGGRATTLHRQRSPSLVDAHAPPEKTRRRGGLATCGNWGALAQESSALARACMLARQEGFDEVGHPAGLILLAICGNHTRAPCPTA
eukprot:1179481-Prymnesium_polylepis.2